MKESIIIRNFGPIKEIRIDQIKPVMLLIGKSATGKSTLMKIIGLFRYLYKYANIASYLRQSRISSLPFKKQFKKLIEANGLASMLNSSTELVYTVEEKEQRKYRIEYRAGKSVKLPAIDPADMTFIKGMFISEFRNVISAWNGYGPDAIGLKFGFYFKETLDLFNKAISVDPILELPYFDMTFRASRASNSTPQLTLMTKDWQGKDLTIKLKDASSGMKTTTPLGVIVNYAARNFDFTDAFQHSVLDLLYKSNKLKEFKAIAELEDLNKIITVSIEEPELSLDPETQGFLIDYIIQSLFHTPQKSGCGYKLMMATHSPYLANRLNLLMARYENDPETGLNPEDVDVWITENGTARSLIVYDEHNRPVIDTEFLSEPINEIYDSYEQLRP